MITTAKALSTSPHFEEGVVNALENGAKALKKPLDKILRQTKIFKFGGTMATNAIMTRSGAKTGLITTSGFEDVIAIARGTSKWFGLPEADIKHEAATRKPDPIVPKNLIVGAIESRIDRDGEVVYPIFLAQRSLGKNLKNSLILESKAWPFPFYGPQEILPTKNKLLVLSVKWLLTFTLHSLRRWRQLWASTSELSRQF